MFIRQAHPGGAEREYRSFDDKMQDARRYVRDEGIPWPVLVDDLAGPVHQAWGGLSDPAYLIDRDGRVAFYSMWTSPKALHDAIEALLDQGGRGVVGGGLRRAPEMGPALTDGWRGLQRALPESAVDMMVAVPFSPLLLWAGYQLRPLLGPVTLRDRHVLAPATRRVAALALVGLAATWLARRVARR